MARPTLPSDSTPIQLIPRSSAKPGFVSLVGLAALVVVVLVSAGVLYAAYRQTTDEGIEAPVVLDTNSVSNRNTTTSVTNGLDSNANLNTNSQIPADWKTYTNNQFGISFKYPLDMTYQVTETQDTTSALYVSFMSPSGDKHFAVSIWLESLDPQNVQGVYGKVSATNIKVGSKDGYLYREGDAGCGGDFIKTALNEKLVLRLYFGSCEEEANQFETDEALRSQLLGSFQFSPFTYTGNTAPDDTPKIKTIESELFSTQYGQGDISNVKCNDSYCLLAIGTAGWAYKIVKYQNGEVIDVSSQFSDLNKDSNSINFSWNGSYWLVTLNGHPYKYDGTATTKIDLPPGAFPGAHGLSWNGSTWLISSVFTGVESRTMFWQYDGQRITVINQNAVSGSINTVAWNGEYWLGGGYDEVSQTTSPLLYRISGDSAQNISHMLAEHSGFSVNDIVWADNSWKLSMYNRTTSAETPLLLSYDGITVSDITNQLVNFQGENTDELSGGDGLYAISAYRRPGLQVWRNEQVIDLTKYVGLNDIDSLETHDGQVLAGAVRGKLLIITF